MKNRLVLGVLKELSRKQIATRRNGAAKAMMIAKTDPDVTTGLSAEMIEAVSVAESVGENVAVSVVENVAQNVVESVVEIDSGEMTVEMIAVKYAAMINQQRNQVRIINYGFTSDWFNASFNM